MILENNLGITDTIELDKMQEKLSKIKALTMFDSGFLINYMRDLLILYLLSINSYLKNL